MDPMIIFFGRVLADLNKTRIVQSDSLLPDSRAAKSSPTLNLVKLPHHDTGIILVRCMNR